MASSKDSDFDPTHINCPAVIARPLEWLLRLNKVSAIYQYSKDCQGDVRVFLKRILEKTAPKKLVLHDVPRQGPLVVMCNHPLGGLEGVMLAAALLECRNDIKVLSNSMLCSIPQFKDLFIGVDVIGKQDTSYNVRGLRQAFNHVKNGGAILIFPAGKVSRFSLLKRKIVDKKWNKFAGNLVLKNRANCLPLYFEGRNSILFYFISLIHPMLGTLKLPSELVNKKKAKIGLLQGKLIEPTEATLFDTAQDFTLYVQLRSELLKEDTKESANLAETAKRTKEQLVLCSDVRSESDPLLTTEVGSLDQYKVLDRKEFSVYCVPADSINTVRTYIGRGRAQSFPGLQNIVAEDLDKYDAYYHQLFMWDNTHKCIVGGYRVGHVADIIEKYGVRGLYCHSLFSFKKKYLPDYKHSIEVGRSYIHPFYQRNLVVLDSIWRGIGRYTALAKEVHTLYGGVCIGIKESKVLGAFIAQAMLSHFKFESKQTDKIRPRTPMRRKYSWDEETVKAICSIPAINKLVGSINEKVAVETLIKHYLNLNGKIVSFTMNPYLQSIDGLIFVDLRNTSRKRLKRYIGEDLLLEFEQRWQLNAEK